MNELQMISDEDIKTSKLDIAELLTSEEVMAGYLAEIMETGDQELILSALGDIARAKGAATLAERAGISRDSIYKALRPGSNPTLSTLLKLFSALHLNLSATARPASA